ncbi:MAG: S49 family peptidase [Casimicrobium sp.]
MDLPSKSICAVLLRLNSSGGSLGAAQSFAEALEYVKRELSIPLICVVTEQALSAAFYVALTCDEVVVTQSALLGSVGAVRQYFSIADLAERIGLDIRTFSSGLHKAAAAPTERITSEQMQAIQNTLDETASHFVEWIRLKRPQAALQATDIDLLSSIVTGAKCVELNLADRIGGLFEALSRAATYSEVQSPKLLRVNFEPQLSNGTAIERGLQFLIRKVVLPK